MKTKYPLFMHVCWFLTSVGLVSVSAVLRRLVHWYILRDQWGFKVHPYSKPQEIGYRGWIEGGPNVGVLGFVRLDGSTQFDW